MYIKTKAKVHLKVFVSRSVEATYKPSFKFASKIKINLKRRIEKQT